MAHSALTVIHSAFLELRAVTLGRFVLDALNPAQDFWPEEVQPLPKEQVVESSFENLHHILAQDKHAAMQTKLSRFLTGGVASEAEFNGEIVAKKSIMYFLKQPKAHFDQMFADKSTRDWLQQVQKHGPVFFVVGLITVSKAEVQYGQHKANKADFKGEVPTTAILTSGASTVVPSGATDVLDVSIGVSMYGQRSAETSFVAPGERVIGVQYRKVVFRTFWKHKDDPTLKANQWILFADQKSRHIKQGAVDDEMLMEASLENLTEVEDLEVEADDYDLTLEDGEYVFLDEKEAGRQ